VAVGFTVAMLPALSQIAQAANSTVYPGSRGPAVKTVEADLQALGYYHGGIDGIYGPMLGTAVRSFQSSQRLATDGIVGPLTWEHISTALATKTTRAAVVAQPTDPVLVEGSQGTSVVHLQQLLNKFGANLQTDGDFGPATLAAVESFQRTHGLAANGVVASATWNALNNDQPTVVAATDRATAAPQNSPDPVLKEGATGSAVVHLQQRLNAFGAHLATDGNFGPATLAAVESFQRSHGLSVDGVVGPATWNALNQNPPSPAPTNTPPSSSSPSVLRLGDTGAAVLTLQRDLTSLGFNTYGEDGVFGPNTEAAVEAFERAEGLTVDGIAGPAVWHAIEVALSTDRGQTSAQSLAAAIVGYARSLVGDPYRYGGASPATGFDCSGLVQYVFAHFGIHLPRSSYAQYDVGTHISYSQLQPGDLVFFATTGPGASHVGIYIGGGQFIAADTYATGVQIDSFSVSYWMSSFIGGTIPPGL
jgi:peptidoglycan hydrolase-like protein with peptidoglycan-binding domain